MAEVNIEQNISMHLQISRDNENRSPVSGSSSDTFAESKTESAQKRGRNPKRKRKWKPYSALSWEEKVIQDARESKRANAKRERLSAEGHPIAPYNTTQFLMDDRSISSPHQSHLEELDVARTGKSEWHEKSTKKIIGQSYQELGELNNESGSGAQVEVVRRSFDQFLSSNPSSPYVERPLENPSGEDIQRFIMNDFSHTYEGLHAEELRSKSKPALIEECVKLERKVDMLEKRMKEQKRKQKEESKQTAQIDRAALLEKINQLQANNAQLSKENIRLSTAVSDEMNRVDTSNHTSEDVATDVC